MEILMIPVGLAIGIVLLLIVGNTFELIYWIFSSLKNRLKRKPVKAKLVERNYEQELIEKWKNIELPNRLPPSQANAIALENYHNYLNKTLPLEESKIEVENER